MAAWLAAFHVSSLAPSAAAAAAVPPSLQKPAASDAAATLQQRQPDAAATYELQQLLILHAVRVCVYAGYQSQVAVMGLPLQLSPEEVSLAAAAGAQQHE